MSWVGKKVCCIDNSGSGARLKLDGIYTVHKEEQRQGVDAVYLVGHLAFFYASRFLLVEDAQDQVESPERKEGFKILPNDDRLWAIFNAPQPGCCKCGIQKEACSYHKD